MESFGRGIVVVRGIVVELERDEIEDGASGCCAEAVDCGMKSDREGRMGGFKKTLENASGITFVSPLRYSMVQSN